MKKYLIFFSFLFFIFISNIKAKTNIYLFYKDTCPHCHKELEFLDSIKNDYDFILNKYEIRDENNYNLLNNVAKTLNKNINGVPFTVIGTYSVLGFNEYSQNQIVKYLEVCKNKNCTDIVEDVFNNNTDLQDKYSSIIIEENKYLEQENNNEDQTVSKDKNKIENNKKEIEFKEKRINYYEILCVNLILLILIVYFYSNKHLRYLFIVLEIINILIDVNIIFNF